jgi:hypothetical protein
VLVATVDVIGSSSGSVGATDAACLAESVGRLAVIDTAAVVGALTLLASPERGDVARAVAALALRYAALGAATGAAAAAAFHAALPTLLALLRDPKVAVRAALLSSLNRIITAHSALPRLSHCRLPGGDLLLDVLFAEMAPAARKGFIESR